jgi:transposase
MARRKFSKEFKREAVRLFHSSGKKLSQVACEIGVRPQVLRSWEDLVRAEEKTGLTTDELAELAQLRKDNDRLKMEVEILKKASFFASLALVRDRRTLGAGISDRRVRPFPIIAGSH